MSSLLRASVDPERSGAGGSADVQYPYADGLARLQLLYRLPTSPAPRRLLVVCADEEGSLIGGGWGGAVSVTAVSGLRAALSQGAERFDAVALPFVLERGTARSGTGAPEAGNDEILGLVRELLVPGGVVVGHLTHVCALRHLLSWSGGCQFVKAFLRAQGIGRSAHCVDRLRQAGLTEIECFYVQPSIDAPMGLIPSQGAASRAHFLRAIRSASGHYGRIGYAVRLLLAQVGWGGVLQPQLFFWARRPC